MVAGWRGVGSASGGASVKVWNFLRAAALALGLTLTLGQPAGAHPHVFIDTIVEVIFTRPAG